MERAEHEPTARRLAAMTNPSSTGESATPPTPLGWRALPTHHHRQPVNSSSAVNAWSAAASVSGQTAWPAAASTTATSAALWAQPAQHGAMLQSAGLMTPAALNSNNMGFPFSPLPLHQPNGIHATSSGGSTQAGLQLTTQGLNTSTDHALFQHTHSLDASRAELQQQQHQLLLLQKAIYSQQSNRQQQQHLSQRQPFSQSSPHLGQQSSDSHQFRSPDAYLQDLPSLQFQSRQSLQPVAQETSRSQQHNLHHQQQHLHSQHHQNQRQLEGEIQQQQQQQAQQYLLQSTQEHQQFQLRDQHQFLQSELQHHHLLQVTQQQQHQAHVQLQQRLQILQKRQQQPQQFQAQVKLQQERLQFYQQQQAQQQAYQQQLIQQNHDHHQQQTQQQQLGPQRLELVQQHQLQTQQDQQGNTQQRQQHGQQLLSMDRHQDQCISQQQQQQHDHYVFQQQQAQRHSLLIQQQQLLQQQRFQEQQQELQLRQQRAKDQQQRAKQQQAQRHALQVQQQQQRAEQQRQELQLRQQRAKDQQQRLEQQQAQRQALQLQQQQQQQLRQQHSQQEQRELQQRQQHALQQQQQADQLQQQQEVQQKQRQKLKRQDHSQLPDQPSRKQSKQQNRTRDSQAQSRQTRPQQSRKRQGKQRAVKDSSSTSEASQSVTLAPTPAPTVKPNDANLRRSVVVQPGRSIVPSTYQWRPDLIVVDPRLASGHSHNAVLHARQSSSHQQNEQQQRCMRPSFPHSGPTVPLQAFSWAHRQGEQRSTQQQPPQPHQTVSQPVPSVSVDADRSGASVRSISFGDAMWPNDQHGSKAATMITGSFQAGGDTTQRSKSRAQPPYSIRTEYSTSGTGKPSAVRVNESAIKSANSGDKHEGLGVNRVGNNLVHKVTEASSNVPSMKTHFQSDTRSQHDTAQGNMDLLIAAMAQEALLTTLQTQHQQRATGRPDGMIAQKSSNTLRKVEKRSKRRERKEKQQHEPVRLDFDHPELLPVASIAADRRRKKTTAQATRSAKAPKRDFDDNEADGDLQRPQLDQMAQNALLAQRQLAQRNVGACDVSQMIGRPNSQPSVVKTSRDKSPRDLSSCVNEVTTSMFTVPSAQLFNQLMSKKVTYDQIVGRPVKEQASDPSRTLTLLDEKTHATQTDESSSNPQISRNASTMPSAEADISSHDGSKQQEVSITAAVQNTQCVSPTGGVSVAVGEPLTPRTQALLLTAALESPTPPPRAESQTVTIFCKRDFFRFQAGRLWHKYQEKQKRRDLASATVVGRRKRYQSARYQASGEDDEVEFVGVQRARKRGKSATSTVPENATPTNGTGGIDKEDVLENGNAGQDVHDGSDAIDGVAPADSMKPSGSTPVESRDGGTALALSSGTSQLVEPLARENGEPECDAAGPHTESASPLEDNGGTSVDAGDEQGTLPERSLEVETSANASSPTLAKTDVSEQDKALEIASHDGDSTLLKTDVSEQAKTLEIAAHDGNTCDSKSVKDEPAATNDLNKDATVGDEMLDTTAGSLGCKTETGCVVESAEGMSDEGRSQTNDQAESLPLIVSPVQESPSSAGTVSAPVDVLEAKAPEPHPLLTPDGKKQATTCPDQRIEPREGAQISRNEADQLSDCGEPGSADAGSTGVELATGDSPDTCNHDDSSRMMPTPVPVEVNTDCTTTTSKDTSEEASLSMGDTINGMEGDQSNHDIEVEATSPMSNAVPENELGDASNEDTSDRDVISREVSLEQNITESTDCDALANEPTPEAVPESCDAGDRVILPDEAEKQQDPTAISTAAEREATELKSDVGSSEQTERSSSCAESNADSLARQPDEETEPNAMEKPESPILLEYESPLIEPQRTGALDSGADANVQHRVDDLSLLPDADQQSIQVPPPICQALTRHTEESAPMIRTPERHPEKDSPQLQHPSTPTEKEVPIPLPLPLTPSP